MDIKILNFELKLHQDCIGTFDVKLYLDECEMLINNVSLYQWKNGSRELYFPSTFKKEPLVESDDLKKFILEELYGNFLKTYIFFKNSIYKESTSYHISINLEHMLQGLYIELIEEDLNELLKELKADCTINNLEIHVTYYDCDKKFEILNSIFKFIDEKYPHIKDYLKILKLSEGLNPVNYELLREEMNKRKSEGLDLDYFKNFKNKLLEQQERDKENQPKVWR